MSDLQIIPPSGFLPSRSSGFWSKLAIACLTFPVPWDNKYDSYPETVNAIHPKRSSIQGRLLSVLNEAVLFSATSCLGVKMREAKHLQASVGHAYSSFYSHSFTLCKNLAGKRWKQRQHPNLMRLNAARSWTFCLFKLHTCAWNRSQHILEFSLLTAC